MFKWSTEFSPNIESPIVPIWINFPLLPLHCFNKKVLFSLASAVGKPLKTDSATAAALQTVHPSLARVCVEANITKALPDRVWIGKGDKGMWQTIQVEDKPNYCISCQKLGHLPMDCTNNTEASVQSPQKQVWIQKDRRQTGQAPQKLPNSNGNVDCHGKGKSVMVLGNEIPSTSRQQPNIESVSERAGKEMSSSRFALQETEKNKDIQHPVGKINEEIGLMENNSRDIELVRFDPNEEAQQPSSIEENNLAQFLVIIDESEVPPDPTLTAQQTDSRTNRELQLVETPICIEDDNLLNKSLNAVNVMVTWEEGEPSLHTVAFSSDLARLQNIPTESESEAEGEDQWMENSYEEESEDELAKFLSKMEKCQKPPKQTKYMEALVSPKANVQSNRKLRARNPFIFYSEGKKRNCR